MKTIWTRKTRNVTTTSIQCLFAIRNERRANDLTVEALVRDIMASAQAALLKSFYAISEFYTAYHKRQERRRHHYRRAMRALSFDKKPASDAAVTAAPQITEIADAPQLADAHIIHFTSYRTGQIAKASVQDDADAIPAAHVCDYAKWASRNATAS